MIVSEIMRRKGREVLTVDPQSTVAEAVQKMCELGVGSAVITDDAGAPHAIITERDVLRRYAQHGAALGELKVADIMSSGVITASPSDSLESVLQSMTDRRFRHMPVVENGKLAGIISIGDVVKFRLQETEREAESLRQYISS